MATNLASAVEDFHSARLQAKVESIVARLTGRSTELLSYEEVRRSLQARERRSRELEDIPLDAIVGSVGRYKDFTRSFLPKKEGVKDRWARVEVAMTGLEGVPPIEVYKIGDAYFVRDGNHRVSVARQLGSDHIQAYVTEVETKVPLPTNTRPDDLILSAEYAAFLEHTKLDSLRPQADLQVTAPGRYRILEEHIDVHRYFMGLEQESHIPYEEAVSHWYDEVYFPVVQAIRQRGILRDFPDRTETDLYVWLSQHRADLQEELGWRITPDRAATDLAARFSQQPGRVAQRLGRRVLRTITPDELEPGPPTGQWRRERSIPRQDDRLFASILVAIRGDETGWSALDQALTVADRENAHLQGLHVLPPQMAEEDPQAQSVRAQFQRHCDAAGIRGNLAFDFGIVHQRICDRARWADLVVASLNYPPMPKAISRLSSGMASLVRRCPSPVLVVRSQASQLEHALLAYDGAKKAREALFVATYIAGRWGVDLTVVSVAEGDRVSSRMVEEAQEYLEEHSVSAEYQHVERDGAEATVADAILSSAADADCDLILMGGYSVGPVVEAVLGSTVDRVLRNSNWPILICR